MYHKMSHTIHTIFGIKLWVWEEHVLSARIVFWKNYWHANNQSAASVHRLTKRYANNLYNYSNVVNKLDIKYWNCFFSNPATYYKTQNVWAEMTVSHVTLVPLVLAYLLQKMQLCAHGERTVACFCLLKLGKFSFGIISAGLPLFATGFEQ